MSELKASSRKDKEKDKLRDMLDAIKEKVIYANTFAEKHKIFPSNPTRILDISCEIDDIVAEIEDTEEA